MEVLAAVSLAGNILQFLSVTCDAISKSRRIHASISGTLKEHDDLEGLTTDLKGLSSRLQASAAPVDSVLEQLCSNCSEVADELLKALEHLTIKGRHTRSQSLRKALKALWVKEKLKLLEQSLAGFRQELTLHVTVELRSRIDVLNCEQAASFQALDDAVRKGEKRILERLSDHRDYLVAATDAQTEQIKALHTQTETILSQELESAAASIAEQSEATRALTAKEQQRTRIEVLEAVADAASGYDDALSIEAENISSRIVEGNENTRIQISKMVERNQEIMKQEISGLQRGLHQLELEIDKKVEELKEILTKINTTREGPKRNTLKKLGNSAAVVLMSLYKLHSALQAMLKSLIYQATSAFGKLLRLQTPTSTTESQSASQSALADSYPQVGISVPMYYAYYYQPLFRRCDPRLPKSEEVFPTVKMSEWIRKLAMTPENLPGYMLEARALLHLARDANELIWTMTSLIAGLNAVLTTSDALLVLSMALSVCYDQQIFSNSGEIWFRPSRTCNDIFQEYSATDPFDRKLTMFLQRPRYALDCATGSRLREDYRLMSYLADTCGLQEEISRKLASRSTGTQSRDQSPGLWPGIPKADLTLAALALISQSGTWSVQIIHVETRSGLYPPNVVFKQEILLVRSSATHVVDFLYAIQLAGIPISIAETSRGTQGEIVTSWRVV